MEMAGTAHLTLVAPDNEKFTVRSAPARLPSRKPNAEYRSREHLTEREVERLTEVAKDNRWGHRDATIVLLAYRHGQRASELVDLLWDQVDLENGSPATLRFIHAACSRRSVFGSGGIAAVAVGR